MNSTPPDGWRTFLIVWGTQAISVIGSSVAFFATTIWLTQSLYARPDQKAELSLALSAVALVAMLPRILGAPIAGAWADRHDRRLTMLAADLVSGLVSLVGLALMASGLLELWSLLVLMLIYTTAASFHFAAFDTSYAVLVSDEQLPRANGMMQTIHAMADVIAPAIAALLIGLPALARQGAAPAMLSWLQEGAALAFGVDAVTFLVAAAGLLLVRIPAPLASHQASTQGRHTLWADVRVGAEFIWQRRPMLWLLGTFTIANLCFSPLMIFVPLVVKFGQAGDWSARGMSFESALALMTGAIGLGGVAGGIAISVWGGLRRRRVLGVVAPMIFAGLMQLIFGLSPRYDLAVAAAFLIALTGPAMNAHSQAIWQAQTPRELQGRVFAVRRLIGQCTAPLGTLMAGVIGGLFNPGHALAALGLLLAVFCTAQLFNPSLRQVDDRHWSERLVTGQTSSVSNI